MKIYITSTPEFSSSILESVVDLLNSTPGVLDFVLSPPLNQKQYSLVNNKVINLEPGDKLTFNDFFGLCEGHRNIREINDDNIVVIISNIKNNRNWFSAYRRNDIFVYGDDWGHFTDKDAKFGIAYQVVENIFQSLIKLKIEGELDELIHKKSIGCINDMCNDKSDITLKFMTAYICPKCRMRAENEISDKAIIVHIKEIINDLRNEFVREGDDVEKYIPPINVREKGILYFGNRTLKFEPKLGSFYIFFLKNLDGVSTTEIREIVDDVIEEYKIIKGRNKVDIEPIAKSLGYKTTRNNTVIKTTFDCSLLSFENVRTLIKTKLKKELGDELHNFYIIDNIKTPIENTYKINLEAEKINFVTNTL